MVASIVEKLRPFLILGRVSNLPTVWTNCLAGWWLGGGGSWRSWLILCAGSTLLYIAGLFLNDAFDADFDRQRRRERPIPSGQVEERAVWALGFGMLALGWVFLTQLGADTAWLSAILTGLIVLYDAVHKAIAFSPVLMAGCRLALFLVAASAGSNGVTGLAVWTSLALAGWIIGLSYVARRESLSNIPLKNWPLWMLAMPIILGLLANNAEFRLRGLVLASLVALWAASCLRHALGTTRNFGRTVSGLLAGICLVDLLAVAPSGPLVWAFIGCFAVALLAQRFVPAT
jgi:hypothetical protein